MDNFKVSMKLMYNRTYYTPCTLEATFVVTDIELRRLSLRKEIIRAL